MIYILFATLGVGALLTTQFMALSASIPNSKSGTIIAVYYMAQQIGIVLGTTLSSSLCRRVFENNLWKNLETTPDAANVSIWLGYGHENYIITNAQFTLDCTAGP